MPVVSMRGQLLVATAALQEPTFARTVILLLEHTADDGALGVVVNRPTTVAVADVVGAVADIATEPAVLFEGGPVSPTTAIGLGAAVPGALNDALADAGTQPGAAPPGLVPLAGGLAPVTPPLVTVDLDHDPALLAASLRTLRVFAGYAGWSPGQLEGEVAEGAWYVVDALPGDAFTADPARLRAAVLRRQGWPLAAAAHSPDDPSLN